MSALRRAVRSLRSLISGERGSRAAEAPWRSLPQGQEAIEQVGARAYVGGLWDEVGRLQLDFCIAQGVEPQQVLVDVACGALRGGVHFIRYLEPGNYLGIDKEASLIEHGRRDELPPGMEQDKRPEFVVSDAFEFDRFSKRADVAIAQSLFTHLTEAPIELCMRNLRDWAGPGCRFFATFFEADAPADNPPTSHDQIAFAYTRERMEGFGANAGWSMRYIGDWGHPRGQIIVEYTAA